MLHSNLENFLFVFVAILRFVTFDRASVVRSPDGLILKQSHCMKEKLVIWHEAMV